MVHFNMQTMALLYDVSQRVEIGSQVNIRPHVVSPIFLFCFINVIYADLPGIQYAKKCK